MKAFYLRSLAGVLLVGTLGAPVLAQDPHDAHPTITAAQKFGHRKVVHTVQATHHVKQHVHNWKHRKEHNVRAWLNKH